MVSYLRECFESLNQRATVTVEEQSKCKHGKLTYTFDMTFDLIAVRYGMQARSLLQVFCCKQ